MANGYPLKPGCEDGQVSADAQALEPALLLQKRGSLDMIVTRDQVVKWLELTAAVMQENKDYLTQLDSPIGDADHGINMNRGFRKVLEKLPSVADKEQLNQLRVKVVKK